MTGNRRLPVLVDRGAAECQGQKVAEQIAKDERHDYLGCIPELLVHAKEAEVEKKNGEFVQSQGEQIDDRGYIDPLLREMASAMSR